MSYIFNGSGDRIECSLPPNPFPTNYTIIAWVKPVSVPAARQLIAAGYDSGTDAVHGASLRIGSTVGKYGAESWWASRARWTGPDDGVAFGSWLGVAHSYNGGAAANAPLIYSKPNAGSISLLATTTELAAVAPSSFVCDSFWIGGVFSSYSFNGRIAYVQLFDTILSQANIDAALSIPGSITGNLVLYLPLESDALDASGNGHHGTVTGAISDADNPTVGGGGGSSGLSRYYRALSQLI